MPRPLRDESVVISRLREVKRTCLTALEHAWVWNILSRLRDRQQWQTVFDHQLMRLQCLFDSSTTYRLYDSSSQQLSTAARTSLVSSILLFVSRATRSSALYRWLTAEPEPDVIVIDLRETWTVGPMISVLDRLVVVFFMAIPDSLVAKRTKSAGQLFRDRPIRILSIISVFVMAGVVLNSVLFGELTFYMFGVVIGILLCAVAGLRSDRSLAELRETRAAALLVAAFEPPEPPESRTDTTPQAVETKPNGDTDSATRE